MKATFLVEVDLEAIDPQSLATAAGDIHDDLDKTFIVTSVKPWARPSVAPIITPVAPPQL